MEGLEKYAGVKIIFVLFFDGRFYEWRWRNARTQRINLMNRITDIMKWAVCPSISGLVT
jgi:hypothetical protein